MKNRPPRWTVENAHAGVGVRYRMIAMVGRRHAIATIITRPKRSVNLTDTRAGSERAR
jgi:hypothetical protein